MYAGNGEQRRTQRIGWLRAAVLGANDDILSASTLVLGVAAAHAIHRNILVAGVAALVAGAMSMAAGEMYRLTHRQKIGQVNPLSEVRDEVPAVLIWADSDRWH